VSDGQTTAVLWGPDFEELGEVGTRTVGERIGLAITRGLHKKAYRYEDPNEDVVAAVAGPASTLLVCADGHNGATAPVVAVQAVLDTFGPDPPLELSDGEWLELFGSVNDRVIARKGVGSPQPASNTVLLVALVSAGRLSWGAIGDGALVVARPGTERGKQLNKEVMRFVGYPMNKRSLKNTIQRGKFDLEPDHWVTLITDGLSEFIAPLRPADIVPRILASGSADMTAEAGARALVDAACTAGAGDNVAAVVMAPA
jgi:serine/threonine protein phosphatase PrpC